jgi:hypothetical protein
MLGFILQPNLLKKDLSWSTSKILLKKELVRAGCRSRPDRDWGKVEILNLIEQLLVASSQVHNPNNRSILADLLELGLPQLDRSLS